MTAFPEISKICYEGPDSDNPLAFRWYNPDEVVALGAALYAAYKGDRSQLTPVQAQSVGMIKVQESTGKHFGTVSIALAPAQSS